MKCSNRSWWWWESDFETSSQIGWGNALLIQILKTFSSIFSRLFWSLSNSLFWNHLIYLFHSRTLLHKNNIEKDFAFLSLSLFLSLNSRNLWIFFLWFFSPFFSRKIYIKILVTNLFALCSSSTVHSSMCCVFYLSLISVPTSREGGKNRNIFVRKVHVGTF